MSGRAAQPKTERSADESSARQQLLVAAGEAMMEAETADVSLQAIARKAGLTAPLVTYHFKTKERLLIALVDDAMGPAMEQLAGLMRMPMPAEQMFRIHISGIIRNYARHPYLQGLFSLLLRDETSETAQHIRDRYQIPLIAAHNEIVDRGIAEGAFRKVDAEFSYFMIVGACQYFFTNAITVKAVLGGTPDKAKVDQYAKTVVDWFLNGLKAPEHRH